MSQIRLERCENCGKPIGRLETAHVWQDRVVCGSCIAKLTPPTIDYATPLELPPPSMIDASLDAQRVAFEAERDAKDGRQAVGCFIMLAGLILLCPFWPAGLAVFLVGLLYAILNTRLW